MKATLNNWQNIAFNYYTYNRYKRQEPKETSEGMKFRQWFHKMGGDKNFTEDQISNAITNKFNN